MQWKIYYDDGTTFDSSQGLPSEAKPLGIQCIMQDDVKEGKYLVSRFDYYWFEKGRWFGGDLFGLYDYLLRSGAVKFGRWIPNDKFEDVVERAKSDPDFPKSNSWRQSREVRHDFDVIQ